MGFNHLNRTAPTPNLTVTNEERSSFVLFGFSCNVCLYYNNSTREPSSNKFIENFSMICLIWSNVFIMFADKRSVWFCGICTWRHHSWNSYSIDGCESLRTDATCSSRWDFRIPDKTLRYACRMWVSPSLYMIPLWNGWMVMERSTFDTHNSIFYQISW